MYIIISPSKTQDFNRNIILPKEVGRLSKVPEWNMQTAQLAKVMQGYSAEELSKMMKVSPKLGALTYSRFQEWDEAYGKNDTLGEGEETQIAPAIVAFLGDVYKGFKLESWTAKEYQYAHEHLGIASGFYGLISALDYIQPYRLEMGTRVQFTLPKNTTTKKNPELYSGQSTYKNLYAFWSEVLTEKMFQIVKKEKVLINLASVEYSKVIDRKLLKQKCIDNWRGGDERVEMQIIDIDFKIRKQDKKTEEVAEKVIGIYAKRARGLMANWIIENKIEKPRDLQNFSIDGWRFKSESAKDTLGNSSMLFIKTL